MPLEAILTVVKDTTAGRHRLNRPMIKADRQTNSGLTAYRPGLYNFYRRSKGLPSLNVNNIRRPDLVPSVSDKAPHPMPAHAQI
jgi:hypothetical protein